MLQPESIGLVCGVLEKRKGDNRPAQYHVLSEVTEEIAKKLETTNPKSNDLDKLQKFCLLLHEATKTRPELYDIPPQHRYFAPLA
jgi:hypothetical protein